MVHKREQTRPDVAPRDRKQGQMILQGEPANKANCYYGRERKQGQILRRVDVANKVKSVDRDKRQTRSNLTKRRTRGNKVTELPQ